uniref:Ig-like domain-containing protein n=1 Tax=Oryzias melastigma TaxID=30732 RepID=A0A3B3CH92_ORYME
FSLLQNLLELFFVQYVLWYKHILGQKPNPICLSSRYKTEVFFYSNYKNNPRFILKSSYHSYNLTISNLKLSDSATYFCIAGYQTYMNFSAVLTVDVKDSGLTIQTSVDQSSSENIHAGDSVTLNCTVHTGSCDGEHRVYWFKDSEDSHPGLIYTDGGRNDHCERQKNTQTNSCVYELPMKNITESHAGIYYCAVVSCGHILFGNGTKLDLRVRVIATAEQLSLIHTDDLAESFTDTTPYYIQSGTRTVSLRFEPPCGYIVERKVLPKTHTGLSSLHLLGSESRFASRQSNGQLKFYIS